MSTENENNTNPTTSAGEQHGSVRLERINQIAVLTLSNPSVLNAMTWQMYRQLEEHLEALEHDEALRVIIVRGDGVKAFAAGTDIQQFQGFTGEQGVTYEHNMESIIGRLYGIGKPTIAAVQGYAVGAGIAIVAACDLRYAAPSARFGVPIGRTLGNCLSLKNYRHIVEAFGLMRAKEMLFTGRLLSASDALQCGFLTALIEEDRLFTHVQEVAQQIATMAPLTIWATKEAQKRLDAAQDAVPYDDVLDRVYGSADFAEGVRAYIEKRKPSWQGK
jgi:enoyl-CoA hydratase/carnithine racemase